MTPRQVVDVERLPPGDRGPFLRILAARYSARRAAVLANGPDLSSGRKAALCRAERSLRKVRILAHRYGIPLDRDDMECAPSGLTDEQRRALAAALADPVSCAFLASVALARAQHIQATHA
jgi:hypothetical protein